MVTDRRITDEDGGVITDLDGVPLYDEGPLEISVHDCADPIDVGPGGSNKTIKQKLQEVLKNV